MNAKTLGRVVGGALFLQVALAPLTYFQLLVPGTSADFLTAAAPHETQIRLGLLLLYVAWGMSLAIALTTLPLFRRHSERLAFLYLGLVLVNGATIAAELVAGRDMLALSLEYVRAGAPKELLEAMAPLARRHRVAAHFANLAFAHASILVMWIILYRSRLVPRLLAGFGILASTISTSAVLASSAGMPFSFTALQPLAVATVLLTLLLLWKGFAEVSASGAPAPSA